MQPRRWVAPMRGRGSEEGHRAATPLELFFDLVIVVAVAAAASELHHEVAEGHALESLIPYALTFFAIWWAWMSFSWFATAYDTDDVPYRVAVFVQMAGAIIIAAGVSRAFGGDWSVMVAGYVVMRLAAVANWIRAARGDASHRANSIRWAIGIPIVQAGWIVLLFVPDAIQLPMFIVLAILELAIPIWAARASRLRWHSDHIAERYGLFTIIVLGESVLAGTVAIATAAEAGGGIVADPMLLGAAVGALLIVFSMWWLYFERGTADLLTSIGRSFEWGYGHYFIWGAAAAVGAGIAVAVDVTIDHAEVGMSVAGAAVAVPVAIYLAGVWALHEVPRPMPTWRMAFSPVAIVLVLLTPLTPAPVLLTGLVVAGLLAAKIATTPQQAGEDA